MNYRSRSLIAIQFPDTMITYGWSLYMLQCELMKGRAQYCYIQSITAVISPHMLYNARGETFSFVVLAQLKLSLCVKFFLPAEFACVFPLKVCIYFKFHYMILNPILNN